MPAPVTVSKFPTADILAGAFDKHHAAMRELPQELLVKRINVDIPTAVATVLGAQGAIAPFRARILALPETEVRCLDDLGSLAYATLYAHISHTVHTTDDSQRLAALMEDAAPLRRRLAADAAAAAARDLLDAEALENIPTGAGRLDTARALLALGVVFRGAWPKVKGRSGVEEAELDRAAQLGVAILTALGTEGNPSAADAKLPIEDLRLRSYSLLHQAYDACRRALGYLRWQEDDANDFAPPLTGPRGPRAKKDDDKRDEAKKDEEKAKGEEKAKPADPT
jgi:hypothetical protein